MSDVVMGGSGDGLGDSIKSLFLHLKKLTDKLGEDPYFLRAMRRAAARERPSRRSRMHTEYHRRRRRRTR